MAVRRVPTTAIPTSPRRVPLATAVQRARVEHAEEIDAFLAWSVGMGRAVDPDVAALLHAAEDEDRRSKYVEGWDRASFYSFYRCDLWNWCTAARCDYPDGLPEVLWLWLYHRDLAGRWGLEDEPLHELLKVLLCYGDIGFDGRPVPGGKTRRLIPCECMVSRRYPREPGPPAPAIEDLVHEAEHDLGPVDRHE